MLVVPEFEDTPVTHRVLMGEYSAEKAEAMLRRLVPGMVPLVITASPDSVELTYSLGGLTDFRGAMAQCGTPELLARLELLAHAAEETPALMGAAWEVFAEDRLFWEDSLMRWEFLLLFDTSAAWAALPEPTPDEIWSALFTAAMEANPGAEDSLMRVVHSMEADEFTIPGLLKALGDERFRLENPVPGPVPADGGAEQPDPADLRALGAEIFGPGAPDPVAISAELFGPGAFDPGERRGEASGRTEPDPVPDAGASGAPAAGAEPSPEDEEEEFRPWENTNRRPRISTAVPLTGTPDDWIRQNAASGVGEAAEKAPGEDEQPKQPLIPGVKPPPPPNRSKTPRSAGDGVLVGDSVLDPEALMPQTTLLDDTPPAPRKPEGYGDNTIAVIETTQIPIPQVVRLSTKETANVDSPYFVIGSKPGAVDFLIQGNRVISRRHAAIITRGRDYFLIDLGSKNGVIVDGKRLPKDQEVQIFVGDAFILANERFKLQW